MPINDRVGLGLLPDMDDEPSTAPKIALIAPTVPVEALKPAARAPKPQPPPPQGLEQGIDRVAELAQQNFQPKNRGPQISFRIHEWLNLELTKKVNRMNESKLKITREAILNAALIDFLKVSPPPD